MGGRSSSSSNQSSSNKSFSQALYGDNSGVMIGGDGNSVNFTDYGAIEGAFDVVENATSGAYLAVMDSNANMSAVADNGLALADSLGQGAYTLVDSVTGTNAALADSLANGAYGVVGGAFDLSSDAMNTNAGLVSESFSLADSLSAAFLESGASMFDTGAQFVNEQGERNLDAAIAVGEAGFAQLQLGSDFITQLNQQSLDTNLQAQQDNNDSLTNGFKSAMQFVEGFSRSDGNAVAETNMKTVGVLAIAAVGVAFAMKGRK